MVKSATNTPLPKGWRIVRLGDVARIEFSSVDKKSIDGETPVKLCNYTDVLYNRRIRGKMQFMTATASPREFARWGLKRGDVLFTKDSETRTEIGIPAYITEDLPNVLCGYHLGRARSQPEAVDGRYLARAFLSTRLSKQLARIANGVTRFGLTLAATNAIELLVPPISEQKVISEVLDAIDDTIEHTDHVIAATERLRDTLLHELLTKGLPGWHTEWHQHPRLGTIPVGWRVARLGNVALVKGGVGFPLDRQGRRTGKYPFIKVSDMNLQGNHTRINRANNYVGTEDVTALRAFVFPPGTIVFPKVGAAIATNKKRLLTVPTIIDNNLLGVTVPDTRECDGTFLYYWFRSVNLSKFANVSAVPSITGSHLKREQIPLPALSEQQDIAQSLDSVDNTVEHVHREKAALIALRESISDALLTGRVRVPRYA